MASAGDKPAGFYYGSDSNYPVARAGYPFQEPGIAANYASYTGEIGTWTNWTGCTRGVALNMTDVNRVNANESRLPSIPGLSLYWFMAGPGAEPHYTTSMTQAYAWGWAQGVEVGAQYAALEARGIQTRTRHVPMMYMDIEGQPVAGYANGWNEVVNKCGQITRTRVIPPAVDRAVFNGFFDYIHRYTVFRPGVYSTPSFWAQTFGTGAYGHVPNTYQWTPEMSTERVRPAPVGFVQGRQPAQWFGGVTVSHQAGWQWTQNGGDWDQFDIAHLP